MRNRYHFQQGLKEICSPLPLKGEECSRYRLPMSLSRWQQTVARLQSELPTLEPEHVQALVHRITEGIQWLDPFMTRYCEQTCPSCEDPCCHGLGIFFNQCDLLYLVASNYPLPSGQTRTHGAEPCRYLGESGCLLSRLNRPYVCAWFLCDDQMKLFHSEPVRIQRDFMSVLKEIRTCRLSLESLYELHFQRT